MRTNQNPEVRFYGEVDCGVLSFAVRSRTGANAVQIDPGYWQVSVDTHTGECWCECFDAHYRKNREKPSVSGSCWHVRKVSQCAALMLKREKLSVNKQRQTVPRPRRRKQ